MSNILIMKPESEHKRKGKQLGLRLRLSLRLKLTFRNHTMIKNMKKSLMKMKWKVSIWV